MSLPCARVVKLVALQLVRQTDHPLTHLQLENPFSGTNILGFSIGRGFGALKGVTQLSASLCAVDAVIVTVFVLHVFPLKPQSTTGMIYLV